MKVGNSSRKTIDNWLKLKISQAKRENSNWAWNVTGKIFARSLILFSCQTINTQFGLWPILAVSNGLRQMDLWIRTFQRCQLDFSTVEWHDAWPMTRLNDRQNRGRISLMCKQLHRRQSGDELFVWHLFRTKKLNEECPFVDHILQCRKFILRLRFVCSKNA